MDKNQYLRRKARRSEQETQEQGSWHSAYFHREFEDWQEIPKVDPKTNRVRIHRVYTGTYYVPEVSAGHWLSCQILYPILTLCAAGLFGVASCISGAASTAGYTIVPQAASLIIYIVLLWCEILRWFTSGRLTVRQYRESCQNVRALALVNGILQLVCAGAIMVYTAKNGAAPQMKTMLLFCTAGICLAGVWCLERRIPYRQEPWDKEAEPTDTCRKS